MLEAPSTVADLEYHLSTLSPPVRPHGYLDVRYLDVQPGLSITDVSRAAPSAGAGSAVHTWIATKGRST